MFEYEKVVDELRNAVGMAGPEVADVLRMATADYAVLCDDANQRLRQCQALLKKGLRAEALHQCEMEPNLLDMVSVLDFQERAQLAVVCRHFGIMMPPALVMDAAAELNEAYALHQPVAALLKQYRLYSLARLPLKHRLGALRKIALADPLQPVWNEDVELFEHERLKEIHQEIQTATRSQNLAQLEELRTELQSQVWSVRPSQQLIKLATDATDRFRRSSARTDLEHLAQKLNDSFAAYDETTARPLRNRWQRTAAICELQDTDPLADQAAPALEWLAQCDRRLASEHEYQQAVDELEQGLNQEANSQTLEALHSAALNYGLDVPKHLSTRFMEQIQREKTSRQRKQLTTIGITVACSLLAIVLITWIILDQSYQGEVASRVAILQNLIEQKQWDDALTYLTDLEKTHPEYLQHRDLEALASQVRSQTATETQRRQSLATLLAAARHENPLQINLTVLSEADALAQTPAEKSSIEQLRSAHSQAKAAQQAVHDQSFALELQKLTSRLNNVENDSALSHTAKGAVYTELQSTLQTLQSNHTQASPSAKRPVASLLARISTLHAETQQHIRRDQVWVNVQKASEQPAIYKVSLAEFLKEYPNDSASRDLQQALDSLSTWDDMQRWNTFARQWNPQIAKLSVAEADKLLTTSKPLLDQIGRYPQADLVREGVQHLEAWKSRVNDQKKSIVEPLLSLCKDPLIENLWMLETKAGNRYYWKAKPEIPTTGDFNFTYYIGYDLTTRGTKLKADEVESASEAPQSDWAKKALAEFIALNNKPLAPGDWEAGFGRVLLPLSNSEKMDVLLKHLLLKRVLSVAVAGSRPMSMELSEPLEVLTKSELPVLKWMDPLDNEAQLYRDTAAKELKACNAMAQAVARATAAAQSGTLPPIPIIHWAGGLFRNAQRSWQLAATTNIPANSELVVLLKIGDQLQFYPIGRWVNQKAELSDNLPAQTYQGMFVLARPS